MPVLSIGAAIADDLNRNYIPTVYSLKQLKQDQLVPKSLIFTFLKRGKSPVNLIQVDVCQRVDAINDRPLATPKFEIDEIVSARHRFRQYNQWFFDDGVNIHPLMKTTLNELSDALLIEPTSGSKSNIHFVTHV